MAQQSWRGDEKLTCIVTILDLEAEVPSSTNRSLLDCSQVASYRLLISGYMLSSTFERNKNLAIGETCVLVTH